METGTVLLWSLGVAGGLGALYGLHRLGLWMEERGYLYYWHKKPRSSPASSFVALQRAIEPRAEHVLRVDRVHHQAGAEGASGQGDSQELRG